MIASSASVVTTWSRSASLITVEAGGYSFLGGPLHFLAYFFALTQYLFRFLEIWNSNFHRDVCVYHFNCVLFLKEKGSRRSWKARERGDRSSHLSREWCEREERERKSEREQGRERGIRRNLKI